MAGDYLVARCDVHDRRVSVLVNPVTDGGIPFPQLIRWIVGHPPSAIEVTISERQQLGENVHPAVNEGTTDGAIVKHEDHRIRGPLEGNPFLEIEWPESDVPENGSDPVSNDHEDEVDMQNEVIKQSSDSLPVDGLCPRVGFSENQGRYKQKVDVVREGSRWLAVRLLLLSDHEGQHLHHHARMLTGDRGH